MRALVRAALCGALALAATSTGAIGPASLPDSAAYLIEADGRTLWSKQADRPLPPASLTKLMTVLVALERISPDSLGEVGAEAAAESGTRLGLARGDRLAAGDLAAAALLTSANDACHALADLAAGNQRRFVDLMNDRARLWGLASTHFANACGHDQPSHRSSARDLMALARRAMQLPLIARLVALPQMEIRTAGGERRFRLVNANALIGRYPGAVGIKSGYTPQAGKCLIAAAQRDGHKVLLVILNGPNRWWDASDALDRAFAELAHPS